MDTVTDPYYTDDDVQVFHGDCLDILAELADASVDSVVTDPPYGLEFMGKEWDRFSDPRARIRKPSERDAAPGAQHNASTFLATRNTPDAYVAGVPFQAWCQLWATECLRVLRPGGHLLAFGGTRTSHRLTCAIEDAGFEIRDSIAWLYGSGFPKSLDVSKAIDKAAGAEREVLRTRTYQMTDGGGYSGNLNTSKPRSESAEITAPATDDAHTWQGWGTALKPAHEPIVVARKPLIGTVAANVLAHGTGALNVDGCRIGTTVETWPSSRGPNTRGSMAGGVMAQRETGTAPAGRWPPNVALDESQAAELDRQSGNVSVNAPATWRSSAGVDDGWGNLSRREAGQVRDGYGDTGGASRFMYVAKAGTGERPRGPDGDSTIANRRCRTCGRSEISGVRCQCPVPDWQRGESVAHPTVKPLSLMRWLVRLVTPPGGHVLDPFAGSGTTAEACILERFQCITIEREADYLPLIVARITKPLQVGLDFDGGAA